MSTEAASSSGGDGVTVQASTAGHDIAAEHSDSGFSASDVEEDQNDDLIANIIRDRYTTIRAYLGSPAGEQQILQSITIETFLSDKCDWDLLIASGPRIVDSFGHGLLVASTPLAEFIQFPKDSSYNLEHKSLRNNLLQASSLGRSAMRDVEKRICDFRKTLRSVNEENNRINKIIDQIEAEELDEVDLPAQLQTLLDISDDTIPHTEKIKARIAKWHTYVADIKIALEQKIERIKKRKAAKASGETLPAETTGVKAVSSASASGSGKPNRLAKSVFDSALLRGTSPEELLFSAQSLLSSSTNFFSGYLGLSLWTVVHPRPTSQRRVRRRIQRIQQYRTLVEQRQTSLVAAREEADKFEEEFAALAEGVIDAGAEHSNLGAVLSILNYYEHNITTFAQQIDKLQLFLSSLQTTIKGLVVESQRIVSKLANPEDAEDLPPKHKRLEDLRIAILKTISYYRIIDELLQTYANLSTSYLMPSICRLGGYKTSTSKLDATQVLDFTTLRRTLSTLHHNLSTHHIDTALAAYTEKRHSRLAQELADLQALIDSKVPQLPTPDGEPITFERYDTALGELIPDDAMDSDMSDAEDGGPGGREKETAFVERVSARARREKTVEGEAVLRGREKRGIEVGGWKRRCVSGGVVVGRGVGVGA